MAEMTRLVTPWDGGGPVERRVYQAPVKIGTMPGAIGLFFSEPIPGSVVEVVEDGPDAEYTPARRVTVDRIDDVTGRVFVSLR